MSVYIHPSAYLVYIQSSYGLANILFTFSVVAGIIRNVCLHLLPCMFSLIFNLHMV